MSSYRGNQKATLWMYYETDGDAGYYGVTLFDNEEAAKAYKKAKHSGYGNVDAIEAHSTNPLHKEVKKVKELSETCPICRTGRMQECTGKYGRFYGCSNWPDCSYTESERLHKADYADEWFDKDWYDKQDPSEWIDYDWE